MILSRELINAVLPATTFEDNRYHLRAVQVEPSGRVAATNGHIMLTATMAAPIPDAEFPIVPGAEFHGSPTGPVLIDADVAKRLIAAMPKRLTIPVLGCLQLSKNGSESTCTLAATDLEHPMVSTIKIEADQRFPEVDRVFDFAGRGETCDLILAVDVLETMIKAAKAAGGKRKNPTITLQIPIDRKGREVLQDDDEGQPLQLGHVSAGCRFTTGSGDVAVVGIAMPCRRA